MFPLPPIAIVPLGGPPLEATLVAIRLGPLLEPLGLLAGVALALLARRAWERRRRWTERFTERRRDAACAPSAAEALQ